MAKENIQPRWFKTDAYFAAGGRVNAEAGVIESISCCTTGEAKGHGVMLDESFIDTLVEQGNKLSAGMKCRFGHPNMSNESLGTYLGRIKNFRKVQDGTNYKCVGDLQLDEVAKNAPGGDLYSYVLGMSEKNPDMFGPSIVFLPGDEYQKDDEGNAHPVKWNSWEGKWFSESKDWSYDPNRPIFASCKDFIATDIVDDPAANESGLFSAKFNQHAFAVQITEFLDQHPEVVEFAASHPEKIEPFIAKYSEYRKKLSMSKEGQQAKLFAEITANTTDGIAIRIDAAGEQPAVGDGVYIKDEAGTESVAPDGDYTIADGPYAGDVLTVASGAIVSITKEQETTEESTQQAAVDKQARLNALEAELSAKQAEIAALRAEESAHETEEVTAEDLRIRELEARLAEQEQELLALKSAKSGGKSAGATPAQVTEGAEGEKVSQGESFMGTIIKKAKQHRQS